MIQKVIDQLKSLFLTKTDRKTSNYLVDTLKSEIRNFRTVLDVGAYQGKFVRDIININSNILFHCFEPTSESYQFLLNKYRKFPRIKINNFAVSNVSGLGVLNINAYTETNSLLESISVNETINLLTKKCSTENVVIINLTEYCVNNNIHEIDLIKIDTQGNSYNVLLGLELFLKEKKVEYLYVEAEFVEIYKNEKLFSEIEILMRTYGYSIMNLYNLNYLSNGQLAWCDILFKVNR